MECSPRDITLQLTGWCVPLNVYGHMGRLNEARLTEAKVGNKVPWNVAPGMLHYNSLVCVCP